MTKGGIKIGECLACKKRKKLTRHRPKMYPELDSYRMMMCEECHGLVTRYEEEVKENLEFVRNIK